MQAKKVITWKELSEYLSKLNILAPDEEVKEITLTKPKQLLIRTNIKVKGE